MATKNQLIIVVEATSSLGLHWPTILPSYLEKILGRFCGSAPTAKTRYATRHRTHYEFQLVTFHAHGSYGPFRSGWLFKIDDILTSLNTIKFMGGGLENADTAKGLAEALMMFSIPANGYKTNDNLEGKRHCILVAASNPFSLPVPVYRPNFDDCKEPGAYHNVETIASWFGKCSVSLSVICPQKLSKIRALYEMGQRKNNGETGEVEIEHENYMVLISEDFKEARAAFNSIHHHVGSSSSAQQHSLPPFQPVNQWTDESLQLIDADAPLALDQEPNAIFSPPHAYFPSDSTILDSLSTSSVLGYQTPSLLVESQDVTFYNENMDYLDHDSSLPWLHIPNYFCNLLGVPANNPLSEMAISSQNAGSSVSEALKEMSHVENIDESSNLAVESEIKVSTPDVVASGIKSSAIEVPQTMNVGEQSESSYSAAAITALSQETSTEASKYIKVWEGDLIRLKQGTVILISKLEAYRKISAPATLVAEWPDSIQVGGLISLDDVDHRYNVRESGFLVFKVLNQHPFFARLSEKKLSAVIQILDQTLLLFVTDKAKRLIGMVFPKGAQIQASTTAKFEDEDEDD